MPNRTTVLLSAVLLATVGMAVSASVAPTAAYAASCSTNAESKPDFDGGQEKSPDIAVGIPDEDLGTQANAGAVEVRYAGGTHKILYPSDYHAGDRFGAASVAGDFNQDHCADLLVGAPGRDVSGKNDAGAIFVYLGSTSGLHYSRTLVQGSDGVPGAPQAGARFGSTLAYAGPVEYQSPVTRTYAGVPGWNVGAATAAGAVVQLDVDGSVATPTIAGKLYTQGSDGVPDTAEAGDRWGTSLVAIGEQGFAAGAPAESVGSVAGAGAVVEYRTIDDPAWTWLTQDTPNMPGTAEANDHFGSALAYETGLIIGVPGEDVGTVVDAGMINAWYTTVDDFGALVPTGLELTQNSQDVLGAAERGDQFGAALAIWRPFWEDEDWQYNTVQVGVPGEDIGTAVDAGMVNTVLYHPGFDPASRPLRGNGGLSADQTAGTVEAGDRFGATLASFRRYIGPDTWNEAALWAIGSPGEDSGAGAVVIADTGSNGIQLASSSLWKQVTGSPEAGDGYGLSIAGTRR
ncbi:integrin alpha [Flindersiella endophytica]